jgi:hypothetical protein
VSWFVVAHQRVFFSAPTRSRQENHEDRNIFRFFLAKFCDVAELRGRDDALR